MKAKQYPRTYLNRLTFYSWGWDLRLGKGYLTLSRAGHPAMLYYSPDATPSHPKARQLWGKGGWKYPR